MHLIECDGCKRLEMVYRGVTPAELLERTPKGWGVKPAQFKGGNHGWDQVRELLIHACRIECAHPAVLRVLQSLPEVSLKAPERDKYGDPRPGATYPHWMGFSTATAEQWDELRKVPLAEGGEPPKEVVQAPRVKKSKLKLGGFPLNPPEPPPEQSFTWQHTTVQHTTVAGLGGTVTPPNFPDPTPSPFLDDGEDVGS